MDGENTAIVWFKCWSSAFVRRSWVWNQPKLEASELNREGVKPRIHCRIIYIIQALYQPFPPSRVLQEGSSTVNPGSLLMQPVSIPISFTINDKYISYKTSLEP